MHALQDREDDVRAVSAEALLPVVHLVPQQTSQAARDVESALWDLLLEVDDLSVSTGAKTLLPCFLSFASHTRNCCWPGGSAEELSDLE